MKVSGGLVGITLNPNARVKFFLIAPELSPLSEQAKSMAGVSFSGERSRHALITAVFSCEEENVEKLLNYVFMRDLKGGGRGGGGRGSRTSTKKPQSRL